jgi:hypothetical protein
MALVLLCTPALRAQPAPNDFPQDEVSSYPETWPDEAAAMPEGQWADDIQQVPMSYDDAQPHMGSGEPFTEHEYPEEDSWFCPRPHWFGLRHSKTHGRHVGKGEPFTGTSWRNRPFYLGGQLGPMWFAEPLNDNVSTDIDVFGGIFGGWDFDHYWGNEFHIDWATPELKNSQFPDADRTDSVWGWNYSLLYYPWGDSRIRPYWRAGIGSTHFDYPTDFGWRYDEWMWTFPLGIGVKYPIQRWLAARMDLTDYISLDNTHPTQHNWAITFGLEYRFGAHPPSYWPWHPHKHVW